MKRLSTLIFACAALLSAVQAQADVRLIMFRHGEKPPAGLGQLNCQGLNRALALPDVLLAAYGRPDALYAPNPGVAKLDGLLAYNYLRPVATLEPTAIRLGLPIHTEWAWNDIEGLQQELLQPAHEGQTLFVAWEHHELEKLARALLTRRGGDATQVQPWHGADFDSIYVLTLPTQGAATFRVDREGLDGQSTRCPGA